MMQYLRHGSQHFRPHSMKTLYSKQHNLKDDIPEATFDEDWDGKCRRLAVKEDDIHRPELKTGKG